MSVIKVDRSKIGPPTVLRSEAPKELANIIAHYEPPQGRALNAAAYAFTLYNHPEIKEALGQLFAGKCAYCESPYDATQPADVEHYRPKGALDRKDDARHSGYYWLAVDWENLLPSCIYCNRRNKQREADGSVVTAGKGSRFPLARNSPRARRSTDMVLEVPLLLDPTREDPERHLLFGEQGEVSPRLDEAGVPSLKGDVSIRIYGLFRVGLTRRRHDHAIKVRKRIRDLEDALVLKERYPEDECVEAILSRVIEEVRQYIAGKEKYTALAREIVRSSAVLSELGIQEV